MSEMKVRELKGKAEGMEITYEGQNLGKLSTIEALTRSGTDAERKSSAGFAAGNDYELTFNNGSRKILDGNKYVTVKGEVFQQAYMGVSQRRSKSRSKSRSRSRGGFRKKRRSSKRRTRSY